MAGKPVHNPVPGGIAVLDLMPLSEDKPLARFGGREVLVVPDGDHWSAVVGLSCDMLPGNYIISLTGTDQENTSVEMGVIPHAPPGQVSSGQEQMTNSSSAGNFRNGLPQSAFFNASMSELPPPDDEGADLAPPTFDFRAPVESRDIVEYGRMPSDNGVRCHDYLSFFLAPGSQVYTPATGMVSRVDSTRGNGMRIILEHGGGALSVLGNLRAVLVETGQQVDQGEILGTVGAADDSATGRLDWAVSLNHHRVDPLQFSTSL